MTSKTAVYIALIAVGLIVLAVDRCNFGATVPASIEASQRDPAAVEDAADLETMPRPAPAATSETASRLSVPELHFPRNLPSYDPSVELRDVFARPQIAGAMGETGRPGRSGSGEKTSTSDAIGREAFQSTHRVDAVMVQESLKIAVVDGRWARVGDVVDTCTLKQIEGDSVVFECHDGDTVLAPAGKRRPASD